MKMENLESLYKLSPVQQGMLFHSLYAPRSGVYVVQLSCVLHGDLNISAFERAWQRVVDRHPILRTAFHWEELEKPLQVVHRRVSLPLEQQDWRGLSAVEQQQRLAEYQKADRTRGFDLTQAPLLRLALFQVAEDSYHFVWSYHHLLLDGWSLPLILKEVLAFYEAFSRGRDLRLERSRPYRDYIAWLQQQDMSQAETFWRQRLQGFTAPTMLGVEQVNGNVVGLEEEDREQQIRLSAATTAALQELARQQQVTLNTIVQGAWALLLSRYSGQHDVVFGTVVSGRPAELVGVEKMVGPFINTLPVRVQVKPEARLIEWLKQLQAQQAEVRRYEYSPLVQVQVWSDMPRGVSLFESLLAFENYPVETALREEGNGNLHIRSVRPMEKTNYPLTIAAMPGRQLTLRVLYDGRRYEADTVQRLLGHLERVFEGMVADPEQRVWQVPLLTESERQQVLVAWNDTQTEYPRDQCVHQLFEAQAAKQPEAVAVVFGEAHLSYGELNRRANQLAHHLQALGVGPGVLVGVYLERSVEMMVGLLGILKAGGAYVPLDPTYPAERLAFMVADAQVPVLLTQSKLVTELPEHDVRLVCLDDLNRPSALRPPPSHQWGDGPGLGLRDVHLGVHGRA
jgi:hypothetical protein